MKVDFFCPICLNSDSKEEESKIECRFCGAKMLSSGISSKKSYNTVKPFVDALRDWSITTAITARPHRT